VRNAGAVLCDVTPYAPITVAYQTLFAARVATRLILVPAVTVDESNPAPTS